MKIIQGDVNLRFLHLKEIPDSIAMDECTGYYDVSVNRLISLKNAAQKADCFDCSKNNLTSLIGGPKFVTDIYKCNHNKLTSLDGIAKFIGHETKYSMTLFCGYNKITSLVGHGFEPNEFYDFRVEHNNLTSLNGSPKIVEATYDCSSNPITSFIGGPREIRRHLMANDLPKLTSLDGLPYRVRGNVYLSKNDMMRIFPYLAKRDTDIMTEYVRERCEVGDDVYFD